MVILIEFPMLRQQEMYRVYTSIRNEYNSTIAELATIQGSKFHLRTRKNMDFFSSILI